MPNRAPHFGGLWEEDAKSAMHLFLQEPVPTGSTINRASGPSQPNLLATLAQCLVSQAQVLAAMVPGVRLQHQEVPNVAVGALVVVAEDLLPPQL